MTTEDSKTNLNDADAVEWRKRVEFEYSRICEQMTDEIKIAWNQNRWVRQQAHAPYVLSGQ